MHYDSCNGIQIFFNVPNLGYGTKPVFLEIIDVEGDVRQLEDDNELVQNAINDNIGNYSAFIILTTTITIRRKFFLSRPLIIRNYCSEHVFSIANSTLKAKFNWLFLRRKRL